MGEPYKEREIVSNIKSMPHGADSKYIELTQTFAFNVTAIVNALPQPLLNTNVPEIDFFSHVNCSFDQERIASVDSAEINAVITDS